MANEEHLSILGQGVDVWNEWRRNNPVVEVNLVDADLHGLVLSLVNFSFVNLYGANLSETHLYEADLRGANLSETNLSSATLDKANLWAANLPRANLEKAHLRGTQLWNANLSESNLKEANLILTNLIGANLQQADLTSANLNGAILVSAKIDKAKLSRSSVYGVSVWDLVGEFEEQKDLIITRKEDPTITVDNIEVAQFIYLILNNKKIRGVLDTLTSKAVLILGRFAIPERKAILDALRNKLREYDLLPIVFDFERPIDRNFTETVQTLAGLCYFVIADVTNPKSSPLELQATIPDLLVPCVPIIQEGEMPFAMLEGLQQRPWVLDTISYDSLNTLIEILKPHIIDPAMKKHDELRKIKANIPTVISGRELKEKKG